MKSYLFKFIFKNAIWLLLYLSSFASLAQSQEEIRLKQITFTLSKSKLSAENEGLEILKAIHLNTEIFEIKPELKKGRKSRFRILLHGIPVHKGFLIFSDDGNRHGKALFPDFNFALANSIQQTTRSEDKKNQSYTFYEGNWKLVTARNRTNQLDLKDSWLDYYDEKGELLFSEDWLLRARPDSIVKATIFKPEPISKNKTSYGGLLKDRNDSTSTILDASLDTVFLKVKYSNDTFSLENQWFKLGEYSSPVKPPSKINKPDFCFKRDNPLFEEVNVFYHLNRFRAYIDSLGFGSMANYQLRIDAHGLDGADQSAYSPLMDILAYGDGNVDDGEDAAVIVHEYCHALANSAFPFGNSGSERRAIEEGFCDYLAGSYCKTLSEWEWEKLFKWDGHNEFWTGRSLQSEKIYPTNLTNEIHKDGEIFSSALTSIEQLIGRAETHKLLFEAMPFFSPNMKMREATQVLLETDTILFDGTHIGSMSDVFTNRGIHPNQVIVSNSEALQKETTNKLFIKNIDFKVSLKNGFSETGTASIIDQNGRLLSTIFNLQSGEEIELPTQNLANGLYFMKFSTFKHTEFQRITILNH